MGQNQNPSPCGRGMTGQINNHHHVNCRGLTAASKRQKPSLSCQRLGLVPKAPKWQFQFGHSFPADLKQVSSLQSAETNKGLSPQGQKEINFVQHYEMKAPVTVCREEGAVKRPSHPGLAKIVKVSRSQPQRGDPINACHSTLLQTSSLTEAAILSLYIKSKTFRLDMIVCFSRVGEGGARRPLSVWPCATRTCGCQGCSL